MFRPSMWAFISRPTRSISSRRRKACGFGLGRRVRLRKASTKWSSPWLRFSMVRAARRMSRRTSSSSLLEVERPAAGSAVRSLTVDARVEMGVTEFMISWVMTRISFCQASISFSSSSRWMFCSETSLNSRPRSLNSVA